MAEADEILAGWQAFLDEQQKWQEREQKAADWRRQRRPVWAAKEAALAAEDLPRLPLLVGRTKKQVNVANEIRAGLLKAMHHRIAVLTDDEPERADLPTIPTLTQAEKVREILLSENSAAWYLEHAKGTVGDALRRILPLLE